MMGYGRYRKQSSGKTWTGHEVMDASPSSWDKRFTVSAISSQETWDSKNGWKNGSPHPWDTGGDFTSQKYETDASALEVDWKVSHWSGMHYTGSILPGGTAMDQLGTPNWSTYTSGAEIQPTGEQTLTVRGTTAISRCAPTNSHADVAVSLGELARDGLPAITGMTALQGRGNARQRLAGEYLNHEFGVKPLISDLKKLTRAVKDSERILSQYYRDSGRNVRRRYSFPSETSSRRVLHQSSVSCWPVMHYLFWPQPYGDVWLTETVEKRTWFSGAFTYYAKPVDDGRIARAAQQANHLLGLGITPDVVYNLTPWSWAADWFTNLGDVLNNVSMAQSDGLVLRYGYIMEEYSRMMTYTWSGGTAFNGSRPVLECTKKFTFKRRRAATPFGFGLLNEDLTPRQWAIIAALGLSRGGKYHALSR